MRIIRDKESEKTIENIFHIARNIKIGISKANIDIGKSHALQLKKEFSKPKHGRLYAKEYKGRLIPHRASKPGEALAIFYGALFRSVKFTTHGWESVWVEYGASSTNGFPYGKYWEELAPRNKQRRSLEITVNAKRRDTINYYYLRIGEELGCS